MTVKKHNCMRNCSAGYFEDAEQIRVCCTECDRILGLIEINEKWDKENREAFFKHWVGHYIHSCFKQVQARYVKGIIIVDCLVCKAKFGEIHA